MKNKRIIVCSECGALYDLHYVNDIKISYKDGSITHFKCNNCGFVRITYKNSEDFKNVRI
jgi:uncharacterized Zn finger protein